MKVKFIINLEKKLRICRKLTWVSIVIFLFVLLLNSLLKSNPITIIIFTYLPICLLLPGIYKEKYKTISMLCFVTLLYFIVAVNNYFSPDSRYLDVLEILILVIMFIVAMLHSRWKQYSLYQVDQN
jgi:uncharacterized membrane protein